MNEERETMALTKGGTTYRLRALTDLWTGDLNGKSDRLITTGLLGSIRWWLEVLVRGLNGNACDPTDTKCEDRNHCVVCELFGCGAERIHKGLVIRRGHKRTIVAVGHKILEVVWAILKHKEPYIDQCVASEAMAVQRNAPRWIKALKKYGYWPVQAQVNQ
ncbi:MAG: type III-B CRISPR module RAMP protein Cmr1 [bacterium]